MAGGASTTGKNSGSNKNITRGVDLSRADYSGKQPGVDSVSHRVLGRSSACPFSSPSCAMRSSCPGLMKTYASFLLVGIFAITYQYIQYIYIYVKTSSVGVVKYQSRVVEPGRT